MTLKKSSGKIRMNKNNREIINLDEPYLVGEFICPECRQHWAVAAWQEDMPPKKVFCTCGAEGKIINTGQIIKPS